MKKAVVIGDNSRAQYHPLKNIESALQEILKGHFEVIITEDYEMLEFDRLKGFDLCISYLDCWNIKIEKNLVSGLLSFISGGGGLVTIHNGISFQSNSELAQLIGARFTGHPPYQKLHFHIEEPEHAIMEGIQDFELEDEPYRFDFDPFTEKVVLLKYKLDSKSYEAAWAHEYGLGRVVYLMPGHDVSQFRNDMYGRIILKSSLWAAGMI